MVRLWGDRPSTPPFPLDQPGCRDAFLFGCLAPDAGYFPGGDRLLSDLAHYLRPVELARNLIESAQTDAERALASGWATHVMADAWIHPLINQAAGEHVQGSREPGLPYADDPATHVRVEVGLDAALPAGGRWPDPPAIGPAPGPRAFAPLARAYRQTYGFTPPCARLYRDHRMAIRLIPFLLLGGRIVGGQRGSRLARWAHGGLARITWALRPGSLPAAFLHPLPSPDWLIEEVGMIVDVYAERFQPYLSVRLAGVPEYNLDTGDVEDDPPSYALSVATLEKLRRMSPLGGKASTDLDTRRRFTVEDVTDPQPIL